ncbi:SDR family oxidoreductase [Allonocardiopsis opalescens]|uniref:Short-subunit dehydrogenase n=1 Tax=Allonocardiopsis opalescens TaxID=1144618 RepID=A0A2T0Q103_9ACTN|nr:SDR family oxidoreductase [Allonocardiopsis opalescens]PRX97395.1 short-subunit dehydrogenase [Allonocardiopsis opalescens]
MTGHPLRGAGVVVTGAGRGIGAAMARRFAAEGARLVLADLDAGAVRAVAAELDAAAVPGDAASAEGVERLVAEARAVLGEIDLYAANAGVAVPGSEQSAEEDWAHAWDVNVMGHVRAARLLMGPWLKRGAGHLVITASAAGLLTMVGAAPYAVTKHAAVAFAEWLAATYAHRGITVQALCPLGVRTRMLHGTGEGGRFVLERDAITPEQVADTVADAVADRRFLILPHPEVARMYAGRAADTDAWLAAMNRIQGKTERLGGQAPAGPQKG